jgi:hypothetical protein
MGNTTQIRQTNMQNGTIFQQPITSGIMTTPTNIVRVNQPQTIQQQQTIQNQGQFVPQTLWTNNISQTPQQQQQFTLQKQTQQSPVFQYATVKNGKNRKIFFFFLNRFDSFRTNATTIIGHSNESYYTSSCSSNSDTPTDNNNIYRISNK